MTNPYQHNCPHNEHGWCLDCVQNLARKFEKLNRKLDEYHTGEAQLDFEMRNDVLKEKIKVLEKKVTDLEYCATMWESQKDLARTECHKLREQIEERDAIIESQICAGCEEKELLDKYLERGREIIKLRTCIEEGHDYGEEPMCKRCGHYGPEDHQHLLELENQKLKGGE